MSFNYFLLNLKKNMKIFHKCVQCSHTRKFQILCFTFWKVTIYVFYCNFEFWFWLHLTLFGLTAGALTCGDCVSEIWCFSPQMINFFNEDVLVFTVLGRQRPPGSKPAAAVVQGKTAAKPAVGRVVESWLAFWSLASKPWQLARP